MLNIKSFIKYEFSLIPPQRNEKIQFISFKTLTIKRENFWQTIFLDAKIFKWFFPLQSLLNMTVHFFFHYNYFDKSTWKTSHWSHQNVQKSKEIENKKKTCWWCEKKLFLYFQAQVNKNVNSNKLQDFFCFCCCIFLLACLPLYNGGGLFVVFDIAYKHSPKRIVVDTSLSLNFQSLQLQFEVCCSYLYM